MKEKKPQIITEASLAYEKKSRTVRALWDTGASATCVDERSLEGSGIKPVGTATVAGVHGTREVNTYIIDIILPNRVRVQDVRVTTGEFIEQGFDMLIGMDIITMGNFAITHSPTGDMYCSFSVPPLGSYIDYVKKWEEKQKPVYKKKKRK